jgi:hypothetical protein
MQQANAWSSWHQCGTIGCIVIYTVICRNVAMCEMVASSLWVSHEGWGWVHRRSDVSVVVNSIWFKTSSSRSEDQSSMAAQ